MKEKLKVYAVACLLALMGVSMALYKHFALGFPLLPDEKVAVWTIESKIEFEANGAPVLMSLALPDSQAGIEIVNENFRALAAGDVGPAQRHIDDALALQPECIRAALLSGRLARQAGRDRDVISAWRRAVQQEPAMLDETIDDIVAAFRHLGDEAGLRDFLAVATRQRVGLRILQVVVDAIRRRDGDRGGGGISGGAARQPSVGAGPENAH